MLDDLKCVMWKEWKSMFRARGGRMRAALTILSPVGLTLYLAVGAGREWAVGVPSMLAAFIAPMTLTVLLVPDSFAGERERRTLPTLLSTRLPDRAILYGKLGWTTGIAFVGTIVTLSLGIVVANVAEPGGGFFFYSPKVLYVNIVMTSLSTLMMASAGVFISMRANTVQEASQLLAVVFLSVPMLAGFALTFWSRSGSGADTVQAVVGALGSLGGMTTVSAALILVDGALLLALAARFRRSRLILTR